MPYYRRASITGAMYFFTVVTYRRQQFLCDDDVRIALREAVTLARTRYPFEIDGWVLLPDHFHCLWTLPADDTDFSVRWSSIKRYVTRRCAARLHQPGWMTASKMRHRESTVWQRRFWEHLIRNEEDFHRHLDYIHFNPVKHGLASKAADWPYSSFHRYVNEGVYPVDWGVSSDDSGEYGEPV